MHSVYWHRWASDRAEVGIEPESQVQPFGPARAPGSTGGAG